MASPQNNIAAPAQAWVYRSSLPVGMAADPQLRTRTAPTMVARVVIPNMPVTSARPIRLLLAAGNISMGMSDSQGPKTKMMKRIQGVMPAAFVSWTCVWVPWWLCGCL